ncbi:MAG: hypothetical protein MN733_06830 [Nitrososphaera sp.]|nr:hypothetical protein [Nitrososphaera sp.]
MAIRSVIVALLLSVLTATQHGLAKVALMPLSDMVASSDKIIIGRVRRTEDRGKTFDWDADKHTKLRWKDVPIYMATIEVERVVKGQKIEKKVFVEYSPTLADIDADFAVGEKILLFVTKKTENAYAVVGGLPGKIEIRNNVVGPVHMIDLEGYYRVNDMIKKISTYLK